MEMTNFNPNGAATEESGIFGLPFTKEESSLILMPIPWEATCSYGSGCSEAPRHIYDASKFVELYDIDLKEFYMKGISYIEPNSDIHMLSKKAVELAKPIIEKAGIIDSDPKLTQNRIEIDNMCKKMNEFVFENVSNLLTEGKSVGLLGGDHSVALGSIKAHLEKYPNMGVLQIDAHADLRESFEGLKYSHASVMHNVISETSLKKLVQVGVRGYCQEEYEKSEAMKDRIVTFYDSNIFEKVALGDSWSSICKEIISNLPDEVYISFDIDGLEQSCCPNTGTPVSGGPSYNQALQLIMEISKSGKTIIGFDLVEVACGYQGSESWDAIFAGNLLYKLCGCMMLSKN
jgi:agmatinase